MYKNKLFDILEIIKSGHIDFFFDKSEEEYNKIVEEALSKYKLENDYDVLYVANVIIKRTIGKYDAHTKIYFNKSNTIRIPYKIRYIDGIVYIINSNQECFRLTKINGIDINVLIGELRECTCYQTEEHFETNVESCFKSLDLIKTLPSINPDDEIVYTVVENNKEKDIHVVNLETQTKQKKEKRPKFSYQIIGNTLKINYNSCYEDYEGQMKEFVDEISQIEGIENYIIDLRENGGGYSDVIKPLINYLKEQNKPLVTFVGKYIFSSGRWAVVDLKNIGSKFIGTGIGTTLNCFGEVTNIYSVPGFNIAYSNKYFVYDTTEGKVEITEKEQLHELRKEHPELFEPVVFTPDIKINRTIEDYISKGDPYMIETQKYFDNICTQN